MPAGAVARATRAAAAIAATALAAAAAEGGAPGAPVCRGESDDLSALQAPLARQAHVDGEALRQASDEEEALRQQADEALRRASDEVHFLTTVKCDGASRWEAELMFYSAQRVGQRGPITAIMGNCKPEEERHVRERHATLGLPEQYKVQFVQYKGWNYMGKVASLEEWFKNFGPERDIVALVDPDFIFVRPLSGTVDRAAIHGEPERKEHVRPGVVAAEMWYSFLHSPNRTEPVSRAFFGKFGGRKPEDKQSWTDNEAFVYACSGSRHGPSGCDGITEGEFFDYHQTGPPYIAHVDDWKGWLLPNWYAIAFRLLDSNIYTKFFVDMMSWSLATMHAGRRQTVVRNLQLIQHEYEQDWSGVNAGTKNPCEDPMDEVLSQPGMPNYLHYTGKFQGWNKHWFSWQVFEHCEGTPSSDAVKTSKYGDGMKLLLSSEVNIDDKRNAFISCVARRMLAGGIRRTCAGRPAAKLVEGIAKGFVL